MDAIDLDETLQTVRTVRTDLLLELINVGSLDSHDEPVLQEVFLGIHFDWRKWSNVSEILQ